MTQDLDYDGIEFPFSAKDNAKIDGENKININVFGYENKQFYPIHVSKGSNEDELNLLLTRRYRAYTSASLLLN